MVVFLQRVQNPCVKSCFSLWADWVHPTNLFSNLLVQKEMEEKKTHYLLSTPGPNKRCPCCIHNPWSVVMLLHPSLALHFPLMPVLSMSNSSRSVFELETSLWALTKAHTQTGFWPSETTHSAVHTQLCTHTWVLHTPGPPSHDGQVSPQSSEGSMVLCNSIVYLEEKSIQKCEKCDWNYLPDPCIQSFLSKLHP